MQTFLPYADFHLSATVLDNKRLNKQIVETRQIYRLVVGLDDNRWRNHPAVRMWRGHDQLLLRYAFAFHLEFQRRYKHEHKSFLGILVDSLMNIEAFFKDTAKPFWLGDERVHSSHRANLLRKNAEHYGRFGWTEEPQTGYYWPVGKEDAHGE